MTYAILPSMADGADVRRLVTLTPMPAAYPMLLDVTHLPVVIVGGGRVAVRKALGLIEAGATDVTVVSPDWAAGMPAVRHVRATYSPGVLAGARLVFAATSDPAVNAAVAVDARAIGALVCRADTQDAEADFSTPAAFRQGPVVVTVSTGSAALTAAVRDGLRERFDPRWAAMAEAMQTLRPLIKERLPLAERPAAFRRLASTEALDVLGRGDIGTLKAWLGV